MNIINTIILTLLVAILGSSIASKLKIPAGTMIGAMFAVALLNITTGITSIPEGSKTLTQIIAGLFIGSTIKRSDVIALRQILKPALKTIFLMLCFSLTIGFIIFKITPYNLATAMLASAPGGIVDMSLIGQDMGADTAIVSILQLVRLISVIGLFPSIIHRVIPLIKPPKQSVATAPVDSCINPSIVAPTDTFHKIKAILSTAFVSIAFGFIGHILKIPAGPLILSMLGVSLQNIFLGNVYMPIAIRSFAQICAGTLIGVSVTLQSILNLQSAIIPAIILVIGFMLMTLLTSIILHKISKLDMITCLFACVPGGATDICLIAGDFGADPSKIIVIQLLRLVCVIAFYPMIISLIYVWL